jgi:hypothetical protein
MACVTSTWSNARTTSGREILPLPIRDRVFTRPERLTLGLGVRVVITGPNHVAVQLVAARPSGSSGSGGGDSPRSCAVLHATT